MLRGRFRQRSGRAGPLFSRGRARSEGTVAMNPKWKSALGKDFQRLFITNGDAASINLNQTVLLQPRKRPRHDFAHRAYSGGDLLVGQNQRYFKPRAGVA